MRVERATERGEKLCWCVHMCTGNCASVGSAQDFPVLHHNTAHPGVGGSRVAALLPGRNGEVHEVLVPQGLGKQGGPSVHWLRLASPQAPPEMLEGGVTSLNDVWLRIIWI